MKCCAKPRRITNQSAESLKATRIATKKANAAVKKRAESGPIHPHPVRPKKVKVKPVPKCQKCGK